MPPQRNGDLLGPGPTARIVGDEGEIEGGEIMGTGLLGEGLKVHGTNGCQYMLNEDWPRRGDATGDTYRCIQRGPAGDESVVAIKVARSTLDNSNSSSSQSTTFIPAAAWDQEVRLLRRLALLGGASSSIERNSGGDRSDMLGGAKTTTATKSGMLCPPAYTIAMVTEFGGLKAMPSARFLVTVPVCWKTLDARVKGAERGYMETYTAEQVRFWGRKRRLGLWVPDCVRGVWGTCPRSVEHIAPFLPAVLDLFSSVLPFLY